MRRVPSTVAALVLTLAAASPVPAQERHLGEVAENIRLNRTEGDRVVIDDQSLPPAAVPIEVTPYPERLATVAAEYRNAVRQLETTLAEMDRGMALYDPVWRESVERACLRLEGLGIEVTAAAPEPAFGEAHEAALEAAGEYALAVAAVRRAVADMTPTIGERFVHLRQGRLRLERAQTLAEETRRALEMASAPEDLTRAPGYDGGSMLCASRYPDDLELQRRCVAVQGRAVQELVTRTAYGLGLDDGTFNTIRNRCQAQWGADYEGRNACERKELAALPPG